MPIVVQLGGDAMIDLGRAAGQAEGAAAAAQIQQRSLERFGDNLFHGLNAIGEGFARRGQLDWQSSEHEKQRNFLEAQQNRALASKWNNSTGSWENKLDAQDLKNQGIEAAAAIRDQGATDRAGMRVGEAGRHNQATEALKQSDIDETVAHHMATEWTDQQRANDGSDRTDAYVGLAGSRREKIEQQVQTAKQVEGHRQAVHDIIDQQNKEENGGVLAPNALWAEQHLAADTDKFARVPLPGQVPQYRGKPMADDQYARLAETSPTQVMRLAAMTKDPVDFAGMPVKDPKTGQPVKGPPTHEAVMAQKALASLPYAPQFSKETGGPQYFARLQQTADKLRSLDIGSADPGVASVVQGTAQAMQQRVAEVKQLRATTLLPQVQRVIDTQAGVMTPDQHAAWTTTFLAKNGISPREFKDWVMQFRNNPTLYQGLGAGAPPEGGAP